MQKENNKYLNDHNNKKKDQITKSDLILLKVLKNIFKVRTRLYFVLLQ